MRITGEVMTNPGKITLFLAEIRIEKSAHAQSHRFPWWGLWFGWWLYKPSHWREWLWQWEKENEGGWHTWMVRLLGFEINWQRRSK